MAERSDAELIALIQTRDPEAFDRLRARYAPALLRHLMAIVHSPDAAEDLLQETLLRVWTRAEQWDDRGSVKAWLYRIGTNLALNSLRSTSRRREIPIDGRWSDLDDDSQIPGWMVDSLTPDPEVVVVCEERRARVRALVAELPEEKRELIRLVYEAELEVKEAARAMGIPEGTAKSRLHYSAKYIAREWRNREDE